MRYCFLTDKDSDYSDLYNGGEVFWYLIPTEERRTFNIQLSRCAIIEDFTEFENQFKGKRLIYDIEDYSFENIKNV